MARVDQGLGLSQLQEGVLIVQFEAGEVEGVVAEFNPLTAQKSRDQIAIALKSNGGGFGHLTLGPVQKGLAQGGRVNRARSRVGLLAEALEGRLTGF